MRLFAIFAIMQRLEQINLSGAKCLGKKHIAPGRNTNSAYNQLSMVITESIYHITMHMFDLNSEF